MKLGGLGEVTVNPLVIADLSHPLNLGAKFLHRREIHMEFKKNCAVLRSKEGIEPLIAGITHRGQCREAPDPREEEDQNETHEPATQEFCKLYKYKIMKGGQGFEKGKVSLVKGGSLKVKRVIDKEV